MVNNLLRSAYVYLHHWRAINFTAFAIHMAMAIVAAASAHL